MFTGLVKEIGTIRAVARLGSVTRVSLDAPACAPDLKLGDSLAADGICLTVTGQRGHLVTVEAVAETRRVTTLADWRAGRRVHLEPALRAGEPLGGHLVQGHVDGVGRVVDRRRRGRSLLLTVALPRRLAPYLLPKGSVAVDGVSLTLDAGPFTDRFTLNLIPHTLAVTRLGELRRGEPVNLEMDVMVKAALGQRPPGRAAGASGPSASGRSEPAPAREGSPAASGLGLAGILARGFRRSGR